MSTLITDAMFAEDTVDGVASGGVGPPPAKKKKSASGKARPPARPYKRVEDSTLSARIAEMHKRSKTLRAKLVILEDRLGAHQQEATLRTKEE
jgi:hypothetical protein